MKELTQEEMLKINGGMRTHDNDDERGRETHRPHEPSHDWANREEHNHGHQEHHQTHEPSFHERDNIE